jgi:hypothetical protein|tara:strand:+ start:909 stop:1154 length:246 start_codon:yes stop_codon:yes gene_type:complete
MAKSKERNISIKVANITPKQWANLVIELNLMAAAWKPYGPRIRLKTHNFERIIKWGRRRNEDNRSTRRSSKKLESNEEFEI